MAVDKTWCVPCAKCPPAQSSAPRSWRSNPLLLDRESLQNGVLVLFVVNRLAHLLEKVTAYVQDKNEVAGILVGLHLHVD